MGSVLGRESAAVLPYDVLKTCVGYEMRAYQAHPIVEAGWQADSSQTFMTLANYIGAFGEPQNQSGQKVAMTAPVEVLPSETQFKTMRFFPPEEYPSPSSLPAPLNDIISTKENPKRIVASRVFSGSVDLNAGVRDGLISRHLGALLSDLYRDKRVITDGKGYLEETQNAGRDGTGLKEPEKGLNDALLADLIQKNLIKDAYTLQPVQWSVAVYNSPFCLPFLRRNEIWVILSSENGEK